MDNNIQEGFEKTAFLGKMVGALGKGAWRIGKTLMKTPGIKTVGSTIKNHPISSGVTGLFAGSEALDVIRKTKNMENKIMKPGTLTPGSFFTKVR